MESDEAATGPILGDTPYNPIPTGAEGGYFSAPDGTRLRYGLFPTSRSPCRGTVLILAGRLSFIEKYYEAIGTFTGLGYDVAMPDLRGQGGSQRGLDHPQKHFVRSFDDYVKDLAAFMDGIVARRLSGPFHMFGHSAGALAGLLAEPALRHRLRAMVHAAPVLMQPTMGLKAAKLAAGILSKAGLGSLYTSNGRRRRRPFEGNMLTGDRTRFERTEELAENFPHLAIGGPTIGYLRSVVGAVDAVNKDSFRAAFRTPTLFIGAAKDEIVSTPAIAAYAKRLPGAEFVAIDDALHDLPQERDIHRSRMFEAVDAFFARHTHSMA